MNKLIIPLLLLFILVAPASAIDYMIQAQIQTVQGSPLAWSTPMTFNLSLNEVKTIPPLTIRLFDFGNEHTQALFTISGGTHSLSNLAQGGTDCLVGSCLMNGSIPLTAGDMRLTLLSITSYGTAPINTSITADNVIGAYLQCSSGEKLYLNRNGDNAYNPSICNTKTGWSNSADKSAIVYFHRNYKVPISTTITTAGTFTEELSDADTKKYTLQSNDNFKFTLDTKRSDAWGGEISETSVYSISVTGLNSATSSQVPVSFAPYDVIVGTTKDFPLPEGTFAANPSLSFIKGQKLDDGRTIWNINFITPGKTSAVYTPVSGSPTTLDFQISPAIVVTPVPTVAQANQNSTLPTNPLYIYLAGVILIIAIAIYIKRGYRKSNRTRLTDNIKNT